MLFGNGMPLQRVVPMLYHIIKLKYPSGVKWEPFLHIFAVYVKSGSKTTPNSIPAYLDATGRSIRPYRGGCHAPARPYAPVSKPGLLDEGRVPRGVQGRAGA